MLCIGCRHDSEIVSFNKNGFSASGIDVAIETDLIKRMNAHDIKETFSENEFDVVYSSHSLEHMYDPKLVLEGIKKISKHGVFIVLPIQINGQPSHSHPTMFDVMLNPPQRLKKDNPVLDDFSCLGEFKVSYYKKSYDEIIMYLTW
jgi:ubiquinone/menaquinone biosynthesis C-methylase UbiE